MKSGLRWTELKISSIALGPIPADVRYVTIKVPAIVTSLTLQNLFPHLAHHHLRESGGQKTGCTPKLLGDLTPRFQPRVTSREAIGTIFSVFGMTQLGTEPTTCQSQGGHCTIRPQPRIPADPRYVISMVG